MASYGSVPSGVFPSTARFYSENDDIFYISSNCVKLYKKQLIKLQKDLTDKIMELEITKTKRTDEVKSFRIRHEEQEQIIQKYRDEFRNTLNNYKKEMTQPIWSPVMDYEKINNKQTDYKHINKKFDEFLSFTEWELQHSTMTPIRKLDNIIEELDNDLTVLRVFYDIITGLLNTFNDDIKIVELLEEQTNELTRQINRSNTFKRYFFDFYLNIKACELQQTKKEVLKIVKKAYGKYKKIMKLRKQNKSVYSYLDLIDLIKDDKKHIKSLMNDYEKTIKTVNKELLEYKTGYYDQKKKEYKIKPFQQHKHDKEINKLTDLFKNDDYNDIYEILNEERNAEYFIVPHLNELRRHTGNYFDCYDKFYNCMLLLRIVADEKERFDNIKKEIDADDVHFTDEEEEEEETENERYEREQNERHEEIIQDLKNEIVEKIRHICINNNIDIPLFQKLTYKNYRDGETKIYMKLIQLDYIVIFNFDNDDHQDYNINELYENNKIDELIEEIRNEFM